MQRSLPSENRKIVPRWRELNRTPAAELASSRSVANKQNQVRIDNDLVDLSARGDEAASLEILSSAITTGRSELADRAIEILKGSDVTDAVFELIEKYEFEESNLDFSLEGDGFFESSESIIERVSSTRKIIADNLRNPILYVQLSRDLATLGESGKATKYIEMALAIAPENRYVIRSAARLFVHVGAEADFCKRLESFSTSDPWILASKVALADLSGRPQKSIKRAREVANDAAASQTTELSAALATVEIGDGAFKKAKRLLKESAKSPNDNSVAQIRWADEIIGNVFDRDLLNVELSFEARSADAFHKMEWRDSLINDFLWLKDEPFSSRAAMHGAFVAAEYLLDFRSAREFCDHGLITNPGDISLLNNRAYALANLGLINLAKDDVSEAYTKLKNDDDGIVLLATEGCISYREGRFEEGSSKYQQAINRAKQLEMHSLTVRAYIHWLYEEIKIGKTMSPIDIQKMMTVFSNVMDVEAKGAFESMIKPLVSEELSFRESGVVSVDIEDMLTGVGT